jgi:hypothetical protein
MSQVRDDHYVRLVAVAIYRWSHLFYFIWFYKLRFEMGMLPPLVRVLLFEKAIWSAIEIGDAIYSYCLRGPPASEDTSLVPVREQVRKQMQVLVN